MTIAMVIIFLYYISICLLVYIAITARPILNRKTMTTQIEKSQLRQILGHAKKWDIRWINHCYFPDQKT